MHAQLTIGTSMVMLSSIYPTPYAALITQPSHIGGLETQSPCITVKDADVVYHRVKEGSAEILLDIKDEDYGGRGFTLRDPGGHVWSVGTYDPWA